jgi:deazaflavin-dependent oxidoreductase (nitroreductase family)
MALLSSDRPAPQSEPLDPGTPSRPIEPKQVPIPRWLIRSIWSLHRGLVAVTGGRLGLRTPRVDRWGLLRLTTIGRRSGKERTSILGYMDDGSDLILMAMNGWDEPPPAWWLNLQAQPDTIVVLPSGPRPVRARVATHGEHPRLWAMWGPPWKNELDGWAANVAHEIPLVVLEPRPVLSIEA